jgi:hypothetical protein
LRAASAASAADQHLSHLRLLQHLLGQDLLLHLGRIGDAQLLLHRPAPRRQLGRHQTGGEVALRDLVRRTQWLQLHAHGVIALNVARREADPALRIVRVDVDGLADTPLDESPGELHDLRQRLLGVTRDLVEGHPRGVDELIQEVAAGVAARRDSE